MQVGFPWALGSKHACEGQSEEEERLKGINNRISALNKECLIQMASTEASV